MGDLFDQVLTFENLSLAWEAVAANNGMPGVDNISIKKWQRNWEKNILDLAYLVSSNHYRPSSLRKRKIPKQNRREFRLLLIPTITDRVLQRAVMQILYEIFEPIFLDCSFGYRPGCSLKQAVTRIVTLRELGLVYVLDADIDEFFNNINHKILLKYLTKKVTDEKLLHLIILWLRKMEQSDNKGIALGSPVSPLLANVYLHELDVSIRNNGHEHIRYADDFIVMAESEQEISQSYCEIEQLLKSLDLRYDPQKTRQTSFSNGFTFIGIDFLDNTYSYTTKNARVVVEDPKSDFLFYDYGPVY